MSAYSGPEIANDGLVFAYDMSNLQKSWKGAPTTNLVSSPRNLSNNRTTPAACGSSFTDFATGGPTDGPFVRVTRVTTSPAADWPFEIYYSSIPVGTSFKFSCSARSLSGTVSTITFSNPDVEYVSSSITPQWQRFSTTFTSGAQSGLQFMRINRSNNNDKTIGSTYDIADVQIEVQSIVTPFVNGTRSNTQAIVDLTNNNIITATSLTYASNNTFSFNGSNSLTVPYNPSLFTFNNEQTIIIWMKNEASVAARRNPYNQAFGGGGTITHENNTNFNYIYGTSGVNNVPYYAHGSPFSVVLNETAQIAITRNVSQTAWYKNGALGNTLANPYGSTVVTGTSPILIGTGYTNGVVGGLYAVQIYNRALTALEIQQNFNATRGRYGI